MSVTLITFFSQEVKHILQSLLALLIELVREKVRPDLAVQLNQANDIGIHLAYMLLDQPEAMRPLEVLCWHCGKAALATVAHLLCEHIPVQQLDVLTDLTFFWLFEARMFNDNALE